MNLKIGVNLPWFDYGYDFGDAPPGWRKDSDPVWVKNIKNNLDYCSQNGIQVIRWFIFGDGLTYGTGANAPKVTKDNQKRVWDFKPPALSDSFKRHFRQLLESFTEFNKDKKGETQVKLLPVLLDYHFCLKGYAAVRTFEALQLKKTDKTPEWIKCGRYKMITDEAKSLGFYNDALEPLLEIAAKGHSAAIFAWDIFNEPEWVTSGWHPYEKDDLKLGLPINEERMKKFLEGAMRRVRDKNFDTTIGFARYGTFKKPIKKWDPEPKYKQFHHYVISSDKNKDALPENKYGDFGIVGEFASSFDKDHWPELEGNQEMIARLKQIDKKKYRWALIWSALATDEHTSWEDAEEGIKKFLKK